MKRIGLLGGMSWESSADCLLRSVDFAGVEELQRTGRWEEAGKLLAAEAQALEAAGMEWDFYVGRLQRRHGLGVVVPDAGDRRLVHEVIYRELCRGIVEEESRQAYRRVIGGLVARGAEGILLGCTEIDLLIGPADAPVPVFDTTRLHAQRAVDLALVTEAAPSRRPRPSSLAGGVTARYCRPWAGCPKPCARLSRPKDPADSVQPPPRRSGRSPANQPG